MKTINEPQRSIPVLHETDICVVGGSCTGVFAAVRAARLGANVAIVEKQNCFGGAAASGLVNVWHSFYDLHGERQIIAGLTQEVIERLEKYNAVHTEDPGKKEGFRLNTEELKIELDTMVRDEAIRPFLHTFYAAPHLHEGRLEAVLVETKSGRGAIKAKFFIDATGDGDLCRDLGLQHREPDHMQPPTACAKLYTKNILGNFNIQKALEEHGEEVGLRKDWGWRGLIPETPEINMHAETHIFDVNCAEAEDLTQSEIEGRRQIRAIMNLIRKYGPEEGTVALVDLPSYIGIRETRHFSCQYHLTEGDLLDGKRFEDAVANGTYPVDIHLSDSPGIVFRHLDGREVRKFPGNRQKEGRWREETEDYPLFYQIPFRVLVPGKYENLLLAGRMLDCDPGSFGAVRVMVNLNQLGEAAGTAAFIALDSRKPVTTIDPHHLRQKLRAGGSAII